jgi:hypothetical protein
MRAAAEDVKPILFIDADRSDLVVRPTVGQFAPAFSDFVCELSGSDRDGHKASSKLIFGFLGKV